MTDTTDPGPQQPGNQQSGPQIPETTEPSSPMAQPSTPAENTAQTAAPRQRKRKKLLSRVIGGILLLVVGLPLLALLGLLGISFFSRTTVSAHVPADFDLYASIPSASRFALEVIQLQALDTFLSTPETLGFRSLVRTLRVNPALRSQSFAKMADVRLDAALYADNAFVAVADLGMRSVLTRLAPLFGRFLLNRIYTVEGLDYEQSPDGNYFIYEQSGLTVWIAGYRNLLIAASSRELLQTALAASRRMPESTSRLLSGKAGSSLRFLARPDRFLGALAAIDSLPGRISASLSFPDMVLIDLDLSEDTIGLRVNTSPKSSEKGLSSLLAKRSRAPAVLSRLPEATEFFSLLSLGRPEELWTSLQPFFDPSVADAKLQADRVTKLAFGKTVDDILFSWMGDEIGLFGTAFGPAPVFFASVADERQRRLIFDTLLDSILIGRDVSAVVNGVRIPRVIFPAVISKFLGNMGINLIEPFYVVEDGILYASASAETLGACLEQIRSGKLLVKTGQWEGISRSVSAESSAMVYYNLDRSLPFFLRTANSLSDTLKLYNIGALSLSVRNGDLKIELSALRGTSTETVSLPGYPLSAGSRVDSDLLTGLSAFNTPMSYWTSGKIVHGLDLSSGERYSLELDDAGYIAGDIENGRIQRLWAVSMRGTIYCLDYRLESHMGFPILSGLSVSGPIAVQSGTALVPVRDPAAILMVKPDGTRSFAAAMYTRSRSAPAVQAGLFAVLPRSFDSWLYLFDAAGTLLPAWPVALSGIASAEPIIVPGASPQDSLVAAVTDSGDFHVFRADGKLLPGFPLSLNGVFDATPRWVPGYNAFVLICDKGILWRIGRDAIIQNTVQVRYINGRNIRMTARDITGDGREELFIGNDGNALMALDADLTTLSNFPLPGSGLAGFVDIDGNRQADLVIKGSDDSINAYKLGK